MAVAAPPGPDESPERIADAKAERSRAYRASQTTRNLIAALLATLAVVLVVILAVPRGEPAPAPRIDVAAVAADVEETYGRPVLVPNVPEEWRINEATVETSAIPVWSIIYVPDEASFVRVAQGFDADETWAAQRLQGAASDDTVDIDGIAWDRYEIPESERTANVSYALGTQAGTEHVLIYGSATPETTARVAGSLSDQLAALREAEE